MKEAVHILAVDDEQVILDSIVKLCSLEDWQVDTAIDAESGLEKLSSKTYHLVISDIMMPGMDGFELLEHLQEKEVSVPVIITTGFSTVENAVKALYTGAVDFLPKPFTVEELLSSVSRALQYSIIRGQQEAAIFKNDTDTLLYIPCPAKYRRLGYGGWAFLEDDGSVKIGITDLFLRTIQSIQHVELFTADNEIIQGNSCFQIETDDELTHSLLAPLSGRILRVNEKIYDDTTLIEKDPYFNGWLYTIVPANLEFELKYLIPCSSENL